MKRVSLSGHHWIVEFYGARALDDVRVIRRGLRNAAKLSGATLLKTQLHHFGAGGGVTGVALLAESHISIHTWPERGYAAIDAFMCGSAEPRRVVPILRYAFKAGRIAVSEQLRGVL